MSLLYVKCKLKSFFILNLSCGVDCSEHKLCADLELYLDTFTLLHLT